MPLGEPSVKLQYGSSGRVSNCKLNSKPPACGFNCGLADWQTDKSHWRCSFIRFPRFIHVSHQLCSSLRCVSGSSHPQFNVFIQRRRREEGAGVLPLSLVSWLHALAFKWPQCVTSCSVYVCVCHFVFICFICAVVFISDSLHPLSFC